MRIGPFEIRFTKAPNALAAVNDTRGGWYPFVREPYTGAWQRNDEWTLDTVLANEAIYSCITLIASDIGKLRPRLVQLDGANGIWTETNSATFSPVLRKPNGYQNRIQFFEWWVMSKLLRGNTYALKERDDSKRVRALHLLDPNRVKVLVAPDGSVWYELRPDNLTRGSTNETTTLPASEIIHDRMNCLFHPLVGSTPIFASGTAANISLNIQRNSSKFFANGSVVSGQLLVPTLINQDKSDELREKWLAKFSGQNNNTAGQIAVLSGGMKFEPLQMTAVDAQLIEQLKYSAQAVCSAFHVPAFKIGIRDVTYNNAEMANTIYYSDCLQSHIEQIELALDEGLGIGEGSPKDGATYGVEFDLSGLIRMDTASQVSTLSEAVTGGLLAPNEARRELGRKPVKGGDTPYLQQQNYSLEALNKRDTQADPFATATPAPSPSATDDDDEEEEKDFDALWATLEKELVAA